MKAFYGSAGASSAEVHAFLSHSRSAPRDVPQMRDQMDNIVFGHEMQDTPQQIKQEQLFQQLQKGSAGQASMEIGSRSFDSRLETSSSKGACDGNIAWGTLGNRDNEPRGDLKGALLTDLKGPGSARAPSAPRATCSRRRSALNYTVSSRAAPSARASATTSIRTTRVRCSRKLLRTAPMRSCTRRTCSRPSKLWRCGQQSRMINDYNAGPFTWVDVDTEGLAEFNAGSQAVQDILSGNGYLERDTDPTAKLIPDEYAAVKGRKVSKAAYYKQQKFLVCGDSVGKLNLLQPDLNFAAMDADGDGVIEEDELKASGLQGVVWTDAKSEFEEMMAAKTFGIGQPPPYGTDPTRGGKPDYTTTRKDDVAKHEAAPKASFERANVCAPEAKGGIRKAGFEPAWHVSGRRASSGKPR